MLKAATPLSMTATGGCQLTAITELSELRQLRDLYRRKWPRHCVGYYCLDNFVRWLERQPAAEIENLHIFTLNGDWRSEGLVLVVDRYQLFVHSLNENGQNETLAKALSLLDWSRGFKVSSFLQRHRSAVVDIVRHMQLALEYDSQTVMYHMPCQRALELVVDCPDGFRLSEMSPELDAAVVDRHWPNRHQGSLFLIKRLMAWNTNVGVYAVDTNELVAWCLRLQGGFLGALQVKESHQRRGFGSLVARAIARRIAETGDDVMALVNTTNVPSRNMFSKLGFDLVDTCYWLRTYPTLDDYQWPEGQ